MSAIVEYIGKFYDGDSSFFAYKKVEDDNDFTCIMRKPLLNYPVVGGRFLVSDMEVSLLPVARQELDPIFTGEKVFVLTKRKKPNREKGIKDLISLFKSTVISAFTNNVSGKAFMLLNPYDQSYFLVEDLALMKIWDIHYSENHLEAELLETTDVYYLSDEEIKQLTIYNSWAPED